MVIVLSWDVFVVKKAASHPGHRLFYDFKMSGSKAPDFDTYGLFRATHSHNPTQYSHIVGLSSHFYAHIGAGQKVFHPRMSKLIWA